MLLTQLSSLSSFNLRFGYDVELIIGCISGLNDVDTHWSEWTFVVNMNCSLCRCFYMTPLM